MLCTWTVQWVHLLHYSNCCYNYKSRVGIFCCTYCSLDRDRKRRVSVAQSRQFSDGGWWATRVGYSRYDNFLTCPSPVVSLRHANTSPQSSRRKRRSPLPAINALRRCSLSARCSTSKCRTLVVMKRLLCAQNPTITHVVHCTGRRDVAGLDTRGIDRRSAP